MEPDERPCFEEVMELLEDITLSDDYLEENELRPGEGLGHASSPKDLRSSISEPILRINDSLLIDNDTEDGRSCGEKDREEHSEIRVRALRLDSVGSSNGSSISSTVDDGYACGLLDLEKSSDEFLVGSPQLVVFPGGNELKSAEETTDDDCVSRKNNADVLREEKRDKKLEHHYRSTEHGKSVDASVSDSYYSIPRKSISLDNSASDDVVNLSNRLNIGDRERNPSIHTLLANEGTIEGGSEIDGTSSTKQGGGDSGIDPGEVDIFKFPLQQDHQKLHSSVSVAEFSANSGDRTPLGCLSPDLDPSAAAECRRRDSISPSRHVILNTDKENSTKGFFISPVLSPSCSTPNLTDCPGQRKPVASMNVPPEAVHPANPSPNARHSFSHSRSSSTEVSPPEDGSLLVTLRERSASPTGQSWASSEFSFTLPSPSTPCAPPSSPNPPSSRHSLPSSPCYRHSPYHSFRRHNSPHQSVKSRTLTHRYSQEISSSQSSSHLRKDSSSSSHTRPKSCRNSALFPGTPEQSASSRNLVTDLQQDFDKMMKLVKTVRFDAEEDSYAGGGPDDFDYDDNGCMEMRFDYASRRQRSKSSPARRTRKTSACSSLVGDNRSNKTLREYGITLKTDLVDFDATCSSKYYKITQTSNTRLSSSTPDLSKFSLQSAPY